MLGETVFGVVGGGKESYRPYVFNIQTRFIITKILQSILPIFPNVSAYDVRNNPSAEQNQAEKSCFVVILCFGNIEENPSNVRLDNKDVLTRSDSFL